MRWYLRYSLSYRDLGELLSERGIKVDHSTLFRGSGSPRELIDAARPGRHLTGDRWFVDETLVKVAGVGRYVYRKVDQYGQVIDMSVSKQRDIPAARTLFTATLAARTEPADVVTERAALQAHVIYDLLPGLLHTTEQHANNRVERDHGRLKARLRPMRARRRTERRARRLTVPPSCRTCAAGTTNSDPTRHPRSDSPPPSTISGQ